MKKLLNGFLLLMASITLGGVSAFAESDLDTVYNDGTRIEFSMPEVGEVVEELPASEGLGILEELIVDSVEEPISDRLEDDLGISPAIIIGNDSRQIVGNTTANPYRKVVYLSINFPNGKTYMGSGNMVSKDTVLTAGHCIYSKKDGGWASSVAVYAGRNGNYAPYGGAYSKKLISVSGWVDNSSSQHDIGAIKLDRDLGNIVGWFGLTTAMNGPITLTGYHGDLNQRQGTETGNLSRYTNTNVYYHHDSIGGSSGSGVYNSKQQILAVHAYGAQTENFGTRITQQYFSMINEWITGEKYQESNILVLPHATSFADGWPLEAKHRGKMFVSTKRRTNTNGNVIEYYIPQFNRWVHSKDVLNGYGSLGEKWMSGHFQNAYHIKNTGAVRLKKSTYFYDSNNFRTGNKIGKELSPGTRISVIGMTRSDLGTPVFICPQGYLTTEKTVVDLD